MTLPAIPRPNERNINAYWEKRKGDKQNIVQDYGLESCLRKIDIYLWLTGKKLDEQRRQGVHQV